MCMCVYSTHMYVCAVYYACAAVSAGVRPRSVLKPSKNLGGGLDICVIYGTLRIFNSR